MQDQNWACTWLAELQPLIPPRLQLCLPWVNPVYPVLIDIKVQEWQSVIKPMAASGHKGKAGVQIYLHVFPAQVRLAVVPHWDRVAEVVLASCPRGSWSNSARGQGRPLDNWMGNCILPTKVVECGFSQWAAKEMERDRPRGLLVCLCPSFSLSWYKSYCCSLRMRSRVS